MYIASCETFILYCIKPLTYNVIVLVANVAERLEEISFLNIKPRRLLKGNQAKMLCCDWSPDKRHIVSSSQVK